MFVEHSSSFTSPVSFYRNVGLRDYTQEVRSGGSFGIEMLSIEQEDFEETDPPYDVLTVIAVVGSEGVTGRLDFGDGWVHHKNARRGAFGPHPAFQECRFELPGLHRILVMSVPAKDVVRVLEEAGFDQDPIRSLYGEMSDDPRGLHLMQLMWNAMTLGGPANNLAVDSAVIQLLLAMVEVSGLAKDLLPPPALVNPEPATGARG